VTPGEGQSRAEATGLEGNTNQSLRGKRKSSRGQTLKKKRKQTVWVKGLRWVFGGPSERCRKDDAKGDQKFEIAGEHLTEQVSQ